MLVLIEILLVLGSQTIDFLPLIHIFIIYRNIFLNIDHVKIIICWLIGWLVVFNVPSTARSFRDGTPIYCPLRRT